jgi:hypothetical protein
VLGGAPPPPPPPPAAAMEPEDRRNPAYQGRQSVSYNLNQGQNDNPFERGF